MWVANRDNRVITAVAAAAPHRVLANFQVPRVPFAVAADPDGSVWVALRQSTPASAATVLEYDQDGRVLRRLDMPAGISSMVLGDSALWVAAYRKPILTRIDRRTARATLGAHLLSPAGSLAYGGGYVWAGIPNEDSVVRIDPRRHRTIFATAGNRPERLVYVRGRLYVACRLDQTLWVMDAKTLHAAQPPLRMPLNPYAVTADRHHVWVTGVGEDTVTRVDLH